MFKLKEKRTVKGDFFQPPYAERFHTRVNFY